MNEIRFPNRESWGEIVSRPVSSVSAFEEKVRPILEAVKKEGDEALKRFSLAFDKVILDSFAVTEKELEDAEKALSPDLIKAIGVAYANITKFHWAQKEVITPIETVPGVLCWRKSIAIQKVGLYIPGGSAPLFSTVLMLGIPARIAGAEEIILCTPPSEEGKIHPAILYCAHLLKIKKIFKVGGAQAIAAMAYGTATIPKVFKIFGPGNQFVTVAKQLVSKDATAIDMPAGPSEVAVLADKSANPVFIAADLLSQAEHGFDSQVLLVTDAVSIFDKVKKEVEVQLELLPRKEFAIRSLNNSKLVLVKDLLEGMQLINLYAPEHLILQVNNAEDVAEKVKNAGSVFLGNYTPEAAGDYASGTNHTLPTNGYATAYSGVSLDSFVKKVTFQKISKEGIKNIGAVVEIMAEAEQLYAHKNAVSLRLKAISNS